MTRYRTLAYLNKRLACRSLLASRRQANGGMVCACGNVYSSLAESSSGGQANQSTQSVHPHAAEIPQCGNVCHSSELPPAFTGKQKDDLSCVGGFCRTFGCQSTIRELPAHPNHFQGEAETETRTIPPIKAAQDLFL